MALLKDGTRVYGNATVDTTLTTGNITLTSGIDTSYIIHEPDSSGDGNGYGTLQLIPDGNLIGGGQYLIVDPTAGGHIHIRGGGAQDNSPANLILGGETSWFQVYAGSNPTVAVASNNNVWTFGTDGGLTLPGGVGIITYGDTTQQDTAFLITRSAFNVAGPNSLLDNIQIGINLGWQPYITCTNANTVNVGVSSTYLSVAGSSPTTEVGAFLLNIGVYSYFAGGTRTFANPNESLIATTVDYDNGKAYSCVWYATSSGQGYTTIQRI